MNCIRRAHVISDRERTQDIQIEECINFSEMYLSESVLDGLHKSGFIKPSPIQLSAIPLGRCGLDLIVQAKSGTGKTLVFSIIALEMISTAAQSTQVLIIAPTREIAVQITHVISSIGCYMPDLKASTFIGGINLTLDKSKLKCCHIAIGTPGRLAQLVELGLLKLENVRLLVFDEADHLLKQDCFHTTIMQLCSLLPHNKQILALSATYTDEITEIAAKLMRSPNHVRLGKDAPALLGVRQYVKLLPDHPQQYRRNQSKMIQLANLLSSISFNQCLVFTNSQMRAESICNQLKSSGWPATYLHGSQPQKERLEALDALCNYACRVLVSTDLSARGLDSEHVNLVVNVDIPWDHATYLHRVGRAGRFGSKGCAISLACEGSDWESIRAISSLANLNICYTDEEWNNNTLTDSEVVWKTVLPLEEENINVWLHKQSSHKNNNKPLKDKNKSTELPQKQKTKNISQTQNESTQQEIIKSNGVEDNNKSKLDLLNDILRKAHKKEEEKVSFTSTYEMCCKKWQDISITDNPSHINIKSSNIKLSTENKKEIQMSLDENYNLVQSRISSTSLAWDNMDLTAILTGMAEGKEPTIRNSLIKDEDTSRNSVVNGGNPKNENIKLKSITTKVQKSSDNFNLEHNPKIKRADPNKTKSCVKTLPSKPLQQDYQNKGLKSYKSSFDKQYPQNGWQKCTNNNSTTKDNVLDYDNSYKNTVDKQYPQSGWQKCSSNYSSSKESSNSKSFAKCHVQSSHSRPSKYQAQSSSHSRPSKYQAQSSSHSRPSKYDAQSSHSRPSKYDAQSSHSRPSKYHAQSSHSRPSKYHAQSSHSRPSKYQAQSCSSASPKPYVESSHSNYSTSPDLAYQDYYLKTQSYIRSAQKFSSMMNYVDTMGRMSHSMARSFNNNYGLKY